MADKMNYRQLIAEVSKPGKIEMPVLTSSGVMHVYVEKSDLLRILRECTTPDIPAPWTVYGREDGYIRLDIQD